MVAIELAHGFCRGPLQLQQVLAKRKPRRHLRRRVFLRVESRGVQRAHHRKDLRTGLNADACIVGLRGFLRLRLARQTPKGDCTGHRHEDAACTD